MNLLHLDSSILGDNSVSRQVSAKIVAQLIAANPLLKTSYHDLATNPLPHLTLPELGTESAKALMAEFKAANIIVIGTPMYNFGIPSQLKAWIDRIAIAGETFKYTESGAVGLMGGKRVIIAASSGGFYHGDAPSAAFNHQSAYLRHMFAFLGITDVEVIAAEGVAMGDDARATALTGATTAVSQLAA